MTTWVGQFQHLPGGAVHVLGNRYRFQVIMVEAQPSATDMVDYQPCWDAAYEVRVGRHM